MHSGITMAKAVLELSSPPELSSAPLSTPALVVGSTFSSVVTVITPSSVDFGVVVVSF